MMRELIKGSSVGSQLLLMTFIGLTVQFLVAIGMGSLPDEIGWTLLRHVLGVIVLFALPPLLLMRWREEDPVSELKLRPSGNLRHWLAALLVLPLFLPLGDYIALQFASWEHAPQWWVDMRSGQEQSQDFVDRLLHGDLTTTIPGFVVLVVIPPVIEEIFFRGTIQRLFLQIRPAWQSIGITSILFAVIHWQIDNLPSIFLLSLLLGWMYWRTRSLWVSILGHFMFNGTTYAIELGWIPAPTSITAIVLSSVTGLAIVLWVQFYERRSLFDT